MISMFEKIKRIGTMLSVCVLLSFSLCNTAFAAGYEDYKAGTYTVETSLSCYVNAMGGIEFGGPLLKGASVTIDQSGHAKMTLRFTKSSVTIHSITCDTFIDINPPYVTEDRGVTNGTIGYYDKNGVLQTGNVSYTLSNDTALNAQNEAVRYVDSITFPLTYVSDIYNLTFFINSNVMGVQFCNKNDKAGVASYPAVLSVKWDKIKAANEQTHTSEDNRVPEDNRVAENQSGPSGNSNSAMVETEEGLNIHYADNEKISSDSQTDPEISYTAYLNTRVLLIIGVCALVFIGAGIIMLISAKKGKGEKHKE